MTKHLVEGGDRIPARFLNPGVKMTAPNRFREAPKPEDKRPLHEAKGPVAEGMVRAEITRRCWTSGNRRLFVGDVIDLTEEDFEGLLAKNFARAQWKPSLKK